MQLTSLRAGVAVALALITTLPAAAQQTDCSDFKWPLTRETTAFAAEGLPTVVNGTPLPGLMEAANLQLGKQDGVAFPVAPTHHPKHDPAYAGTFALPPIASADTYQVTLSDDAWVDVVQDGKIVKQVGFTGSHTCKAIHKSVRFDLKVGPATVEISDAATQTLKIEVLPKEH
ncbi:hypothetical protein [Lichenifustis flavocetrariae]|uniref:PA14 domain-containing protein n=1 Tax=Lichenifustis flavocetrariae TaxID=2949735 RepID=A0AA42CNA0_9HYPH|nr:hypothetical protein [Lichenifustis flavocetrariae]MCW6509170.1 hypothetical protein [Lichenifustis flavocetrariae]